MISDKLYHYRAKLVSVYDGDTIVVDLDLGRGVWVKDEKIRLRGIDTPERRSKDAQEKAAAYLAREALLDMLHGNDLIVETFIDKEEGKFGRLLGVVYVGEMNVNEAMIDRGWARKYDGGKRIPWVEWDKTARNY